ncbi:hypothetical protein [Pontibacter pamirensis]|nr:hypothetical protein [Pontibacter pamirensis]
MQSLQVYYQCRDAGGKLHPLVTFINKLSDKLDDVVKRVNRAKLRVFFM